LEICNNVILINVKVVKVTKRVQVTVSNNRHKNEFSKAEKIAIKKADTT